MLQIQYDRGLFYPGVFQFAFELSSYRKSIAPPKLAVLTARAKEFKFALAIHSRDPLSSGYQRVGKKNGFDDWGIGNV